MTRFNIRDVFGKKKMKLKHHYFKTMNGFYCPLKQSMVVSEDGEWVAGIQVTDNNKYQLVKENFLTKKYVIFKYVHGVPAESVVLDESRNKVITGGLDKMTVVYDWTTGEVIKVLDIIVGPLSSLYRINGLLILGEPRTLRFVDSINDVEIKMNLPVTSHCKYISCITVAKLRNHPDSDAEPDQVLIYGGTDSPKLNVFLIQEDLKGGVWSASKRKTMGCTAARSGT